MDYEKKYKEALEIAKGFMNPNRLGATKEELAQMFPELAESEDEKIRKSLIDMLKNDEKCYLKEIDWLEKQKPIEWSEEDKIKISRLYSLIGCMVEAHPRLIGDKEAIELEDFLKSLHPQTRWKPTEGQMEALNETINFLAEHHSPHLSDYLFCVLRELRDELKKL